MGQFEPMVFEVDEPSEYEGRYQELESGEDPKEKQEVKPDASAERIQAELDMYKRQLADEKAERAKLLSLASRPAAPPVQQQAGQSSTELQKTVINYDDQTLADNPNEAFQDVYERAKNDAIAEIDARKERRRGKQVQAQQKQQSIYQQSGQQAIKLFSDSMPDMDKPGSEAHNKWGEAINQGIQAGKWTPEEAPLMAAHELSQSMRKPVVDDTGRQARVRSGAMHTERKPEKKGGLPTLSPEQINFCRQNNINPDSYRSALKMTQGGS